MNAVAKNILLNIDSIVLATPTVICTSAGAGLRWMEESKSPILSSVGWLGSRVCVGLGVLAGVPLFVWNCAKAIFAKLLNVATMERFEAIRNYANYTDLTMKVTLAAVPAAALTALVYPTVIKTAISVKDFVSDLFDKGKEIFEEIKKAIENFQKQDGLQGIADFIKAYNDEQNEKLHKVNKEPKIVELPQDEVLPLAMGDTVVIQGESKKPVISGNDSNHVHFELPVEQIDANAAKADGEKTPEVKELQTQPTNVNAQD